MNTTARLTLILWPVALLAIFAIMRPRRAVLFGTIAAWLFLPNGGFKLPGLPDYTKSSATNSGLLLCVLLFDSKRLLNFRPKWYDLPMALWCVGYVVTAVLNDHGLYDGL